MGISTTNIHFNRLTLILSSPFLGGEEKGRVWREGERGGEREKEEKIDYQIDEQLLKLIDHQFKMTLNVPVCIYKNVQHNVSNCEKMTHRHLQAIM